MKAMATRRRILDAAETLFVRDGYAATTVTAIADAADVAVQTVYAVFGSKRAVLAQLIEVRVTGDDQPVPVRDREDWQALELEPDAGRQLVLLAAVATRIGSRMAALYEVMAGAAGSDLEIAEMYRRQRQARYQDQRRIAQSLARTGALREGLSEAQAADIIWTLANPHTYHALVSERQWSAEEYERWLSHTLTCSLLA
jgi:AcrR family transcriptional regulator